MLTNECFEKENLKVDFFYFGLLNVVYMLDNAEDSMKCTFIVLKQTAFNFIFESTGNLEIYRKQTGDLLGFNETNEIRENGYPNLELEAKPGPTFELFFLDFQVIDFIHNLCLV